MNARARNGSLDWPDGRREPCRLGMNLGFLTATVTVADGQVTVFAAVDHCTTECVGLHAAKRFEALEPIR
ncbi:MAG: hypothetical protein HY232_12405 [Acidobacteria bacterium]|nr:hypothetical protein [Acidobacteriota bacterium]